MSDQRPQDPRVAPTPFGALATCVAIGLVVGWAIRPITQAYGSSPVVTWIPVLALAFVAVLLGAIAWVTHRTISRRLFLDPHRAVNRLVLAKACALVGALVAGGYAGYAVAWLGMSAELAEQRTFRAALAALAAGLMCVTALLLERACRVRDDDDEA